MLQISHSGQELQGTAQVKEDPLPIDHHCLQAGDYYPTILLLEVLCFLLQAKLSGLALAEGQWRAHTE